ncbi:diacylglycerol lipase-beta-like isoform X2 [Montipora capricornis]|uniref:diacylglycerol lipase-beta-like isoform X2 n=1 Tax=Montipora capricornis TaxID=246305 RepID=UPI0035F2125F
MIVGHSLGAGTASLLSVLLKPIYPDLKCFAYSNPSVLSTHATPYCEDFIVSVVLGKDVVPRMTGTSASELRDDLASVIRRCSLPKYHVLMSGCWQALCFCLGPRPHNSQGEAAGLTSACDSNESSLRYIAEGDLDPVTTSCSPVSVEKLYPAGRILQLDERISNRIEAPRFDVMWSDKDNYSKIIIHPDMLGDHFPDRVMKALGRVAASVQEDALLQEV